MKKSFLRSRKLSYRGWTLERFKRAFLMKKRPIPVYKEIDQSIIEQEIERVFSTDKQKRVLLGEINFCLNRLFQQNENAGIITPDQAYGIVLTNYHESPKLVLLLGIIREYAFRNIGGGSAEIDLDQFDFSSRMQQLLVFDLQAVRESNFVGMIYGSYRYQICRTEEDYLQGAVGMYFEFDSEFTREVRAEMGRALINPYYKGKSFDPVFVWARILTSNLSRSNRVLWKGYAVQRV